MDRTFHRQLILFTGHFIDKKSLYIGHFIDKAFHRQGGTFHNSTFP